MTMNCKSCDQDKPEAEMFERAGKRIRTCKECKSKQMRSAASARAKTMQSVQISASSAIPSAESSRSVAVERTPKMRFRRRRPSLTVLDILPGWGVNAALNDGRLVLKQLDSAGNTDEISLSQSEARALFAHFRLWAA